MKRTVILVAGGKGLRMGGELPKQFIPLHGRPVLMHTMDAFFRWDAAAEQIIVLPEEQQAYWQMLCRELNCSIPHRTVHGGETRFHSVRNGLQSVDGDGWIAVHDGVRPFVSHAVIDACFAAAEQFGAAVPVLPMIDSVREVDETQSRPFDRERLRIVQTPQVFRADWLRHAYEQPYQSQFTDDASLVEAAGYPIHLVDGNRENIKITTPVDWRWAEILAKEQTHNSPEN